ncbi:MAG: hypothetical protein HPY74_19620 [Firmicutes bacterium]|nr:hypothetical protein [Bacillota bacterium]
MLKKVNLILLVVIMITVVPLSSFAQSADNIISADEAAMRLQAIFEKYGDGKYQVADFDKNQVFDRNEIEKLLNDIEEKFINEKEEKTEYYGETVKSDEIIKSTLNQIRVPWMYMTYTQYDSGYDNVGLGIFGTGKVDVSWEYDVTLVKPADQSNWAYLSCTDPRNISKGYTGIGTVIYNNITSSESYLYNPHPVRGYYNMCSFVSGEIQIRIDIGGLPITITDTYTVQKTHTV